MEGEEEGVGERRGRRRRKGKRGEKEGEEEDSEENRVAQKESHCEPQGQQGLRSRSVAATPFLGARQAS